MKSVRVESGLARCAAAALASVLAVAGCGDDSMGTPDAGMPDAGMPDAGMPDAGMPDGHEVRVEAVGVLAPVRLSLSSADGSDELEISQDGTFGFQARLAQGVAYTVSLVGTPECMLEDTSGTAGDAAPVIRLTCSGVAALDDLALANAGALDLGFARATFAYDVDVSVIRQVMALIPTAVSAEATIEVAGAAVASGEPSALMPLALGENQVEVVVSHPLGWSHTYTLTVRRAAAVAQYAYGKASNTGANDELGLAMALSGDTLAVAAPNEDSAATGVNPDPDQGAANDSGAVYVFRRSDEVWAQEAYLKASNTGAFDNFGWGVALEGDTLVVGAPGESSAATGVDGDQGNDDALDSGAVYVFERSGETWTQAAYLKASNTEELDNFGYSVALSGDVLVAGAVGESSAVAGVNQDEGNNDAVDSGAVYVFRRSNDTWAQEAYIKASNTDAGDELGTFVALSGDTLAVSAPFEDSATAGIDKDEASNDAPDSGAVYVFRHDGNAWAQEAYVKASNTDPEDLFGWYVALSGDVLAVGAPQEDSAATGVNDDQANEDALKSGAVYVYRRSGAVWAQEAYVKASNTGTQDRFGASVALSGELLAVGAVGESSAATGVNGDQAGDGVPQSGAVYVFVRREGVWGQESYVKASNTGAGDLFGYSLALSEDVLAVGARAEGSDATGVGGEQGNNGAARSGAVYLFY